MGQDIALTKASYVHSKLTVKSLRWAAYQYLVHSYKISLLWISLYFSNVLPWIFHRAKPGQHSDTVRIRRQDTIHWDALAPRPWRSCIYRVYNYIIIFTYVASWPSPENVSHCIFRLVRWISICLSVKGYTMRFWLVVWKSLILNGRHRKNWTLGFFIRKIKPAV